MKKTVAVLAVIALCNSASAMHIINGWITNAPPVVTNAPPATNVPPVVVTNVPPLVFTNALPKLPAGKLVGYSLPHFWSADTLEAQIKCVESVGMNCGFIEFDDERDRTWDQRKAAFEAIIPIVKRHPEYTLFFSAMHGAGPHIANGQAFYESHIKWLEGVCRGITNMVLSPINEVRSGQDGLLAAAERLWTGRMIYNGAAGRPSSKPGRYEFIDYHQTAIGGGADVAARYGNKCLMNTDDGILNQLQRGQADGPADRNQIESWMRSDLPKSSIQYYPYLVKVLDTNVVRRMGEVLRSMYPNVTTNASPVTNAPPVTGNVPSTIYSGGGNMKFSDGWVYSPGLPDAPNIRTAIHNEFHGSVSGITDETQHYYIKSYFRNKVGVFCASGAVDPSTKRGYVIAYWRNGDTKTGIIDWYTMDP